MCGHAATAAATAEEADVVELEKLRTTARASSERRRGAKRIIMTDSIARMTAADTGSCSLTNVVAWRLASRQRCCHVNGCKFKNVSVTILRWDPVAMCGASTILSQRYVRSSLHPSVVI